MSSSGRELRRRASSNGRRNRLLPPHPSSPSLRRRSPSSTPKKSEQDEILHKCSSEPLLPGTKSGSGDNGSISFSDRLLYRQKTCTDVFSPSLLSPDKAYQEDYKVVVTVTVDGSTGPVRTMVKLGSSVDETIKLVLEQYSKEGRNPSLDQDSASQFELHFSSFSFESLDRSVLMGRLGSRNFYLRKRMSNDEQKAVAIEMAAPESTASCQPCLMMVFLPDFISTKFEMILRKIQKLWKMLGCLYEE